VLGEKTMGEEYCNLLQVDTRQGDLPPLWKRLLYTLSSITPPLLSGSKDHRLRLAGKLTNLLLTIQVSLFYFGWIPAYHASKWLLGLRYIIHPRKDPQPRRHPDFLYLLLGIASLCMAASEGMQLYKELHANKAIDEPDILSERLKADETCTLCLNQRKDSSCLACGHVFCWTCICKWLHHRQECPLCREPAFHADILHLQNLP
jgi:peroxin-10